MTERLRDVLSPLYGDHLSSFFDRPTVQEARATCEDCAMCDKGGNGDASGAPADLQTAAFRPDVKCCSYHPTLPNYLVGAALGDADPQGAEGRARLSSKIAARVGITPHWIAAPRKYLVLLDAAREACFGRSEILRCPYYDVPGGTCTIWRHREAVCTTFFCKHVSGATGHALWSALKHYLVHAERALVRYAAMSVAPEVVEPDLPRNRLLPEDLADQPPREAAYRAMWGTWVGREAEFYVACARVVRSIETSEFRRVVDEGPGAELLAALTVAYERCTRPALAERLLLNPDMLVVKSAAGVAVATYSRYDSLVLTDALYEALTAFTGKDPVDAVLERLRETQGVDLPRDLLLQMQQFGVVTETQKAK